MRLLLFSNFPLYIIFRHFFFLKKKSFCSRKVPSLYILWLQFLSRQGSTVSTTMTGMLRIKNTVHQSFIISVFHSFMISLTSYVSFLVILFLLLSLCLSCLKDFFFLKNFISIWYSRIMPALFVIVENE